MEFSITRGVIEKLEHVSTDISELDKLERGLFFKVSEELLKCEKGEWICLSVVRDLLYGIQGLTRHHAGCFTTLDEIGIMRLMSDLLRKISESLTDSGFDEKLQPLIESSTDTLLAIGESDPQAKAQVIEHLLVHILDLFEHPALLFKPRMEVLKSVNMLLEQCPVRTKENILEDGNIQSRIIALIDMVMWIGDYELQVCIIECLMRIFPRKARQKYAAIFFKDENLKEEFLSIRDKVFETDCRLFLNNLNARNEDPTKGVYSFSCITAFIGSKQLRKPDDASYDEFWVDFNIGSMRVTLFCAQEGKLSQDTQMDEDLWETLEICKSNVKKYSISNQDVLVLEINLRNSISQLYPSQHCSEQGDTIRLEFDLELVDHVSHAVSQTFNFDKQKKSKVSTVEFPLQISVKIKDLHDVTEPEEKEVGNQNNSQDQCSAGSSGKKRKVSIPSVPMKPSLVSSSAKSPGVKVAANKSIVEKTVKRATTPRIPVKSTETKVKVKTPVVEICDFQKKAKDNNMNEKKKTKKTKDVGEKDLEDIVILESQSFANKERSKDGERKQLGSTLDSKAEVIDVHQAVEEESKLSAMSTKSKMKGKSEEDTKNANKDGKELLDSKIDSVTYKTLTKQTTEKKEDNKGRPAKIELKDSNFDDIDEVDTVPDSLEFINTERNQEDTVRNLETPNKETGIKKTLDNENGKKIKKTDTSISKGNKIDKEEKSRKSKRSSKAMKRPSFTDADESLKEMCNLENINKPKKTSNQLMKERRPLSLEKIDEIYTFKNDHKSSNINSKVKSTVENTNSRPVENVKTKTKDKNNKKVADTQKKTCHEEDHTESNEVNNAFNCENEHVKDKTIKKKGNEVQKRKECDTTRSLRTRKMLPNYQDISETEIGNSSICIEQCKSDIYNDNSKLKSKSVGPSVSNIKKIDENESLENHTEKSQDVVETDEMIHQPTRTSLKGTDPAESQIVTFNSDESDTELHETDEHREQCAAPTSGRESRQDNLETSCDESLYVETDDSCNARNFKMFYKDKKRRSSFKNSESLKSCLLKSNISSPSNESIVQQEKDKEMRHRKEKGKNVSFDESVLKDKTPIKKLSKACDKRDSPGEKESFSNQKHSCIGKEEKCQNMEKKVDKSIKSKQTEQADKNSQQHLSYSKLESKCRPWGMLKTSSRKKCGVEYDPFDFDAQSDNTSNRSERLDRIDMSKSLNEKYGRKSTKKSAKTKKERRKGDENDCKTDDHGLKPTVECNAPSLMVQDQVTKKWHRSGDKTCNTARVQDRLYGNEGNCERFDDPQSSSPIGSDTGLQLPLNMVENDRTNHESANSFQNILRDIESKRRTKKLDTQDECIDKTMQPREFGDNLHISPIQTPHISSTSTPKISTGKRKQYTPLNISVIKTPQSATPCGKTEGAGLSDYQDDVYTKTSSKNSRQTLSSDTDSIIDSRVNSEKSWIKSEGQRRKKAPVTYKQKKRKAKKTYTLRSESPSPVNYHDKKDLAASKQKLRRREETLPTLKSAILKLKEIGVPASSNDEADSGTDTVGSVDLNGDSDRKESKLISQENLIEQILTPYTPVKSENSKMQHEFDISTIQTQEDLTMRLSDEDAGSRDLTDFKFKKQTLLGDSGFQSGPSSAVRPSSTSLKRKYPLKLINENDDDDDDDNSTMASSDESSEKVPLIPRKLFRYDPSVPETTTTNQAAINMTDCTGDSTSSCSFDVGFSSYLNSLGLDVRRQMKRKQEQVEMFTKQAVKELQKHHCQNWLVQREYRSNVYVEFKTKMMLELEALERDVDLLKDAELKTTEVFKYQLDALKQNKARQISSLSNMKGLNSYLKEKSCKVTKYNKALQNDLRDILRKDMTALQRKLIQQTQKEELSSIKRNLQRTFSTSSIW